MANDKMYDLIPIINGNVANWATNFSVKYNVATIEVIAINVRQIRSLLNNGKNGTLEFSYGLHGEVEYLGAITGARISAIESPVDEVSKISIEFTYAEVKR